MTIKSKHVCSTLWRRKALVAAIACAFAGHAQANGVDPTVVAGQASFSTAGKSLTITNSPGAIINWRGFSIDAGETTRFVQQSAASSILNRVIGSDPSVILGALTSNGRVFLINPAGILVGAGARIDVAGLAASTLNLSNQDFLAGRLNFTANPQGGKVENQGSITTPSGGSVYLVGANVTNSGIISSPQGDVILAAGQSVKILDSSTPGVRVELTASDNAAVNLGQILAHSGQIGIYGAALRNAGIIDADQVVRDAGGKIVLRAKQDVTLDAGSRLSANGEQGGEITVQSETGTTLVSGTIEAKGTGTLASTGGTVKVLGHYVGLMNGANVNVSGNDGGIVLVGGNFHGSGPEQNASATYVAAGASVNADAIGNGNGGSIALWSEDVTRVYGAVSARGGAAGGNGGFVETSSHNQLDVTGMQLDLRAPQGQGGTWLIDPFNVTITAAATVGETVTGGNAFAPNTTGANIQAGDINTQLNGGVSVTITTAAAGAGTDAGNITQDTTGISKTAGGAATLTMIAAGTITTGAAISSSVGLLNVVLRANDNTGGIGGQNDQDTASGNVLLGGAVTTNGGTFQSSGVNFNNTGGAINSGGGNVTLTHTGSVALAGVVTTLGGAFQSNGVNFNNTGGAIDTGAGNITLAHTGTVTLGAAFTAANANIIGSSIGTSSGAAHITAGTLNLAATTTIGAGNPIETTVSTINAVAGSSIAIVEADAVTLGTVSSGGSIVVSNTTGSMTLGTVGAGIVSAGGPVTLATAGTFVDGAGGFTNISVAAGQTVTLNGGAATSVEVGTSVALAGSSTGATPVTNITVGNVTSVGGVLRIYSPGDMTTNGTITAGGDAQLNAPGYVTVNGVATTTGAFTATAGGALTLGGTIGASGTGNAVVLAGSSFINSAGVAAITTPGGGRWLVYSSAPSVDTFGSLSSGNLALWNKTYAGYPPASVSESGNRYLFANQPALTVTADANTKVYGDAVTLTSTVTGLMNAASYGGVFTQDAYSGAPSLTSPGTAPAAGVSGYTTTTAAGGFTAPAGYGTTSYVNGSLTVTQRAITVTATAGQTKTYGNADPASYTYANTDLGAGTALAGALDRAAGENVGAYAIGQGTLTNANNTNYLLTYVGDNFGITQRSITLAATVASKTYGNADPASYTYANTDLGAGTALAGALDRAAGENVGAYAIGQGTLTNANNTNYFLTYVGDNFGITPATLNVVANPQTKTFGASDPALSFTVAGLVNNPLLGIADTEAGVISGALARVPGETAAGGPYAITQGSLATNSNYALGFTGSSFVIVGAATEPVFGLSVGQLIFAGVVNNQTYYRPGNFWHVSLNSGNADPGFDVMRGTSDANSRTSRRMNSCDSVISGGFCETWSFPQQRTRGDNR